MCCNLSVYLEITIVLVWQVCPFEAALAVAARLVDHQLQPFDLFSNCTLSVAFPARLEQLKDALFIDDKL